jgi:hypothetical protein
MKTESFATRLARQMAENNPGIAVRVGTATHAAIGERERSSND